MLLSKHMNCARADRELKRWMQGSLPRRRWPFGIGLNDVTVDAFGAQIAGQKNSHDAEGDSP